MSNTVSIRADRTDAASDLELAQLASGGDPTAFKIIMQRNNARLYRVARSVLKNDSDAEDAVQEAYLKAYGKLSEFRGDSSLSTWLTRIVLNEALMSLRCDRRTTEVTQLVAHEMQSAQVVRFPGIAQGLDPEKAAATRQVSRLIERAVDALPVDFRLVFVMRCIEEMSGEETADQLAIPEATVKTRLHRARLLLRRTLEAELGTALTEAFPFGGTRCARITEAVLARLQFNPPLPHGPGGSGNTKDGLRRA
jgi:RNA polymerase sigma-70 factor (ECF subfamily)